MIKNDQKTTLEVKNDNNFKRTGNLLFEIGKMRGANFYEGWLSKCKAKYLCIYDNIRKCGIIIDFP